MGYDRVCLVRKAAWWEAQWVRRGKGIELMEKKADNIGSRTRCGLKLGVSLGETVGSVRAKRRGDWSSGCDRVRDSLFK